MKTRSGDIRILDKYEELVENQFVKFESIDAPAEQAVVLADYRRDAWPDRSGVLRVLLLSLCC